MACYDEALRYGKTRTQFDRPIAGFQIQQVRLVEMLTEITKAQLFDLEITSRQLQLIGEADVQAGVGQIVAKQVGQIFHGGLGLVGDGYTFPHQAIEVGVFLGQVDVEVKLGRSRGSRCL